VPPRVQIGGQRTAALHAPVQRVEQELVVVDHVVEPGAHRVQLVEPLHVGGVLLHVLDLPLQLLDDEAGAPLAGLAVADDVAVDVVADVEHLLAGKAAHPLEIKEVSALVDAASLQGFGLGPRHAAVGVQLHEGPVLGEEGRLLRPHHHVVEVVAPGGVFGQPPVEQEAHHRVGVVPQRIGEDEELLAAGPQLVQRLRQLRVGLDEAAQVLAQL